MTTLVPSLHYHISTVQKRLLYNTSTSPVALATALLCRRESYDRTMQSLHCATTFALCGRYCSIAQCRSPTVVATLHCVVGTYSTLQVWNTSSKTECTSRQCWHRGGGMGSGLRHSQVPILPLGSTEVISLLQPSVCTFANLGFPRENCVHVPLTGLFTELSKLISYIFSHINVGSLSVLMPPCEVKDNATPRDQCLPRQKRQGRLGKVQVDTAV